MERFTMTTDHIKLLRAAWTSWDDCEYGAPCIDPKRPYGNSDVPGDIVEILGWDPQYTDPEDPYDLTDEQAREANRVHRETEKALQIVLTLGTWEPGTYERGMDSHYRWRPAR